ncbi:MAG: sensor histidine kinase [Planctomycetota bacterium]
MRLLLLAFGGAAAAFMVWSLWLIRSVGASQRELTATVSLMSRMRDLEPSLRELADVLSDAATSGASAVDEERWMQVASTYANSAARIPREGESANLILRTDHCAQRILALVLDEQRTPGTPEVRLARLSEARTHLNRGIGAVRESVQVLLQVAAGISTDLDRQRRQLDYIAFVACLLAALATALMELNRRDNRRRLAAEGSLFDAHAALEAHAQDLLHANRLLHEEIGQRTRSELDLAKRTEELERSNAELERFAYVASHDLQEPLRAVASHVQILQEDYQGKLDADADESIRHAVEGAAHMRLLINDLLAYSRIGRKNEVLQPTSAEHALATALRQLEVSIEEANARIVHDEKLPEVLADPTQLIQLFQNLIGNAIKFRGKDAPRVTIGVEPKGEEWVFCVRDNGIGIAPEHAERIFAPFERLHGRHEYAGTGIGLAICKKIVERHGGRIWVESEVGRGCAFYFTFGRSLTPPPGTFGEELEIPGPLPAAGAAVVEESALRR